MNAPFIVTCPYCGETVEIYLESDVEGHFVQDCEVCCNPWEIDLQNTCPLGLTQAVDVKTELLSNQRFAGHMTLKNG